MRLHFHFGLKLPLILLVLLLTELLIPARCFQATVSTRLSIQHAAGTVVRLETTRLYQRQSEEQEPLTSSSSSSPSSSLLDDNNDVAEFDTSHNNDDDDDNDDDDENNPYSSDTAPQTSTTNNGYKRDKLWLETATDKFLEDTNVENGESIAAANNILLSMEDVNEVKGLMSAWARRGSPLIVEQLLKRIIDDMHAGNDAIFVSTRFYAIVR
jgi:hypothetical protein